MAQLEHHYVEREGRLTRLAYSDLVALAWMVPGPVGCNVAVQLGYVLRGRVGAWASGIASVLPFFIPMTLFAAFYRTSFVHAASAAMLLNHLRVVLAMLIAVTWYRQIRTLVRGWLDGIAAAIGCVALLHAHSPIAYVVMLGGAFLVGWLAGSHEQGSLEIAWQRGDRVLLAGLSLLVVMFGIPLPPPYDVRLIWLRLGGAGLTLFGGGFSALPVLKTLFVTPATAITENDFTLGFALSPVAPGPLLNVVPFFGYLAGLWPGALMATLALFAPSGCLVVLAQRHLRQVALHPRFGRGMRALRSMTTAFLAVAVLKIGYQAPWQPDYLLTAIFALLCFATRKVPVYAVYGTVAFLCIAWMLLWPHG